MRTAFVAPLVVAFVLVVAPAFAAKPLPDISAFTVGKSTAADVIKANGKPNDETANSDGTTSIVYRHVVAHVKGASFIPVVGMFAGGAIGHTELATFVFNPDGTLKSATKTTSTADCGAMLAGAGCH